MPNHIHMIIRLEDGTPEQGGRDARCASPTKSMRQRSYHDHIIRNENEYNRIVEYIENNPKTWHEDRFYPKQIIGHVSQAQK